jgi:hypothetical protein
MNFRIATEVVGRGGRFDHVAPKLSTPTNRVYSRSPYCTVNWKVVDPVTGIEPPVVALTVTL